jgi:hypothetical protein
VLLKATFVLKASHFQSKLKNGITQTTALPPVDLSKIVVYLRVSFVPLQILSINQALDPFLQVSWLYWKFKL